MNGAPKLRLVDASFHERPVRLRLPFRFGVVTLTEAPQLFVRAQVRLADGRQGEGISAELLVPKWFDKSPELSNERPMAYCTSAVCLGVRSDDSLPLLPRKPEPAVAVEVSEARPIRPAIPQAAARSRSRFIPIIIASPSSQRTDSKRSES